MKPRNDGREQAAKLRWWAEEVIRDKTYPAANNPEGLSPQETQQTLHELRVHQIELEVQNEELRRVQVELDELQAKYLDLYNLAPVGYCILSPEGRIREANLAVVNLLGVAKSALLTQPISRFILSEDQDIYYLHRKQFLRMAGPQTCELRMLKHDGTSFWARLVTTAEPAGDERAASRLVLSDITERKQVEAEKASLEAQLRLALKQPAPNHQVRRGRTVKTTKEK